MSASLLWGFVYALYPPVLRLLEGLRAHRARQPYLIGSIDPARAGEIRAFLLREGFENAVLAWRDPGEVLSLRKAQGRRFQYHVRVFSDGEVRAHYEYSPEGAPWGHVREHLFIPKEGYFRRLLRPWLGEAA